MLIVLSTATVVVEITGRDAEDVCTRVSRSMRLCGVRGAASIRDGVVIIREVP